MARRWTGVEGLLEPLSLGQNNLETTFWKNKLSLYFRYAVNDMKCHKQNYLAMFWYFYLRLDKMDCDNSRYLSAAKLVFFHVTSSFQ